MRKTLPTFNSATCHSLSGEHRSPSTMDAIWSQKRDIVSMSGAENDKPTCDQGSDARHRHRCHLRWTAIRSVDSLESPRNTARSNAGSGLGREGTSSGSGWLPTESRTIATTEIRRPVVGSSGLVHLLRKNEAPRARDLYYKICQQRHDGYEACRHHHEESVGADAEALVEDVIDDLAQANKEHHGGHRRQNPQPVPHHDHSGGLLEIQSGVGDKTKLGSAGPRRIVDLDVPNRVSVGEERHGQRGDMGEPIQQEVEELDRHFPSERPEPGVEVRNRRARKELGKLPNRPLRRDPKVLVAPLL